MLSAAHVEIEIGPCVRETTILTDGNFAAWFGVFYAKASEYFSKAKEQHCLSDNFCKSKLAILLHSTAETSQTDIFSFSYNDFLRGLS